MFVRIVLHSINVGLLENSAPPSTGKKIAIPFLKRKKKRNLLVLGAAVPLLGL
jgi:hypothetical protein